MQYVSTRNKELKVSAASAIATGIAPDGGLFCPESFAKITDAEIQTLCTKNYRERAAYILAKFLEDFSPEELKTFTEKAYSDEKFGSSNTAPLVKLADGKYILELWHGPTCAFKDMALQMLPYLLTASLKKTGEDRTACILVATSGDTGKAALDGFADVEGTKVMVYYPETGVSRIQKLQMVTQKGENVEVCAINGNFDDAQTAVKKIFTDKDTIEKLDKNGLVLSSANSINWGRLAPQIAYYISAYCDMVNNGDIKVGDKINVCVPTGNFGNILAAYIAKQMGLAIDKFVCASNANNVLTDFLATGEYNKNRPFYITQSPSMDILISSNLERLIYFASGMNDTYLKELMEKLSKDGSYKLDDATFSKIKNEFVGGFCDDKDTASTLKRVFESENYLADTHTAVAIKVYEDYRKNTGDTTPTVIASTASPYKFCSSVLDALGKPCETDGTELLDILSEATGTKIPKTLLELKDAQIRFETVIDKNEILESVDRLI